MILRKQQNGENRLFTPTLLQAYLNVGRITARSIADQSGAVVKIGKRVLFDKKKIDEYIDRQASGL